MSEVGGDQPVRRTTWTLKENILRVLWGMIARPLWRLFPFFRVPLLRIFGATVGRGCRLAGSVEVYIPWHLSMGANVQVGERAILYSLGHITIGDNVVFDYRAHVCAGTHDMSDPGFPLQRLPITIGAGSFIGFDAFVGPGVTLGDRCVLAPRACVYKDAPDDTRLRGNPAHPVLPATEAEAPPGGGGAA